MAKLVSEVVERRKTDAVDIGWSVDNRKSVVAPAGPRSGMDGYQVSVLLSTYRYIQYGIRSSTYSTEYVLVHTSTVCTEMVCVR